MTYIPYNLYNIFAIIITIVSQELSAVGHYYSHLTVANREQVDESFLAA